MEIMQADIDITSAYEQDFAARAEQFEEKFRAYLPRAPQRFPSPARHYRARIEFALHRVEDARLCYVMFDKQADGGKRVRRLETSELPLRCISERMHPLLRFLERRDVLSRRLFQVNWRADLDGQVMLSLLYRRQLEGESAAWLAAAAQLAAQLGFYSILGRSKSQRLHVGPAHLDSRLDLPDGLRLHMRQSDTCFSQPNTYVNQHMLSWARSQFRDPSSDLLELYCGIGNFTCALGGNFRRVLATEVVRQSIQLCRHNLAQNGLQNVEMARLSAAETAQALAGERKFTRLQGLDLSGYRLQYLLLDPPRSGLDEPCRRLAMNFANILYISCNPNELLRDLNYWRQRGTPYRVSATALFDQFPYTKHLEAGLLLRRETR